MIKIGIYKKFMNFDRIKYKIKKIYVNLNGKEEIYFLHPIYNGFIFSSITVIYELI